MPVVLLLLAIAGNVVSQGSEIITHKRAGTGRFSLIGEETGGSFEGPTGGDNIVIQLPNSKIMVRISPNIQVAYPSQKFLPGRGVIPSYQMADGIEDILNRTDLELNFVKKLIRNK